jgi:hypothetical protein
MMRFRVRFLPEGHHTSDVNLVANKVVPFQRMIIFVTESEGEWLSPSESLGQSDPEVT